MFWRKVIKNALGFDLTLTYDQKQLIMKTTKLFSICILLLFVFSGKMNGQTESPKQIIINNFYKKKEEGYLKSLGDTSVTIMNLKKEVIEYPIIDIETINVVTKKDQSGIYTVGGMFLGAMPGLLILADRRARNEPALYRFFDAIGRMTVGPVVALGGTIFGGVIGYHIGKGAVLQVPIYGNKDLYKRQNEKLTPYLY